MTEIHNTITEKNLNISYVRCLQMQNKYTIFASIAQKEHLLKLAKIFINTANIEGLQAKSLSSLLKNTNANTINFYNWGNTLHNLKIASNGEHFEWSQLYYRFANIAKEEYIPNITDLFNQFAKAENQQALQYLKLIQEAEKIYINRTKHKV